MYVYRCVATIALVLAVCVPASAQAKKDKDKPAGVLTSREILSSLQHEVDTAPFGGSIQFKEVVEILQDLLAKAGKNVRMYVDEEAFREESPDGSVNDAQVRYKGLRSKATINQLLRQAIKQLPIPTAFVIRGGHLDIVPAIRTEKKYLLNQTFHAEFKDRPLMQAIEELSELTGVSIIMDSRVKEKATTPVTGRFHEDVAVQDAVRMLTDMADLKMVYLVTGIYVTTPEHAAVMQKELKQIYEAAPVALPGQGGIPRGSLPGFGGLGGGLPGGGLVPSQMGVEPLESPLAPPLPPSRRRVDAAA
jgi:hypothetical protein